MTIISPNGKPFNRIDPIVVRAALEYDPDTGVFLWKHRSDVHFTVNLKLAGKSAGCIHGGYLKISINRTQVGAHRLAWAHVTGAEPIMLIDHVDGNPLNNAFKNLRQATNSENVRNSRVYRNNVSGIPGVSWNSEKRKWKARIDFNGAGIHLGYFDSIEIAAAVRSNAAVYYHGEFRRVG